MKKRNIRIIWWGATLSYLALTYATLGLMPRMWKKINASLGGNGLAAQYIIYAISGIAILFYIVCKKREKSVLKYLLLLFFAAIFFVMIKFEKNPGEKIHMGQYGLFGVLLYNALKIDFNRFKYKLYLLGAIICLAAGALDEVIQGILPNRYFTWHDVFINGASGVIALLIVRFNILRWKTENKIS